MLHSYKLLVVFFLTCVASAQYRSGTVVAIVAANGKISVAADSRVNPTQGEVNDTYCKILVFRGRIAVASLGYAGFASKSHPADNWNADDELRKIAAPAQPIETLISSWLNRMKEIFDRELSVRKNDLLASLGAPVPRYSLVTSIFVDSDTVSIRLAQVSLMYDQGTYSIGATTWNVPLTECEFVCGFGRSQIIEEIRSGETKRGSDWRSRLMHMAATDRASEAVRLTILNYPDKRTVGGPIDLLSVSRRGIDWKRRKKDCQKN